MHEKIVHPVFTLQVSTRTTRRKESLFEFGNIWQENSSNIITTSVESML